MSKLQKEGYVVNAFVRLPGSNGEGINAVKLRIWCDDEHLYWVPEMLSREDAQMVQFGMLAPVILGKMTDLIKAAARDVSGDCCFSLRAKDGSEVALLDIACADADTCKQVVRDLQTLLLPHVRRTLETPVLLRMHQQDAKESTVVIAQYDTKQSRLYWSAYQSAEDLKTPLAQRDHIGSLHVAHIKHFFIRDIFDKQNGTSVFSGLSAEKRANCFSFGYHDVQKDVFQHVHFQADRVVRRDLVFFGMHAVSTLHELRNGENKQQTENSHSTTPTHSLPVDDVVLAGSPFTAYFDNEFSKPVTVFYSMPGESVASDTQGTHMTPPHGNGELHFCWQDKRVVLNSCTIPLESVVAVTKGCRTPPLISYQEKVPSADPKCAFSIISSATTLNLVAPNAQDAAAFHDQLVALLTHFQVGMWGPEVRSTQPSQAPVAPPSSTQSPRSTNSSPTVGGLQRKPTIQPVALTLRQAQICRMEKLLGNSKDVLAVRRVYDHSARDSAGRVIAARFIAALKRDTRFSQKIAPRRIRLELADVSVGGGESKQVSRSKVYESNHTFAQAVDILSQKNAGTVSWFQFLNFFEELHQRLVDESRIPPELRARLRVLFESLDRNGDGCVSENEFIQGARKDSFIASCLGQRVGGHQELVAKSFGQVFDRIGRDAGTGQTSGLSWEQFVACFRANQEVLEMEGFLGDVNRVAVFRSIFAACDVNRSGFVPKSGLLSALRDHETVQSFADKAPGYIDVPFTVTYNQIFQDLQDNSWLDTVSWVEFLRAFRKHAPRGSVSCSAPLTSTSGVPKYATQAVPRAERFVGPTDRLEHFRKLFRSIDHGRDGLVSKLQFVAALKKDPHVGAWFKLRAGSQGSLTAHTYREILTTIDVDSGTDLTWAEFVSRFANDASGGSGTVPEESKGTLPRASTELESQFADGVLLEKVRRLFAQLDRNGDGVVSRQELVDAIKQDPSLAYTFNLDGNALSVDDTGTRLRARAINDLMAALHAGGTPNSAVTESQSASASVTWIEFLTYFQNAQADALDMLVEGMKFSLVAPKSSGEGAEQSLVFVFYEKRIDESVLQGSLYWTACSADPYTWPQKIKNAQRSMVLGRIKRVFVGKYSPLFQSPQCQNLDPQCCVTLVTRQQQLNLVAATPLQCRVFVSVLTSFIVEGGKTVKDQQIAENAPQSAPQSAPTVDAVGDMSHPYSSGVRYDAVGIPGYLQSYKPTSGSPDQAVQDAIGGVWGQEVAAAVAMWQAARRAQEDEAKHVPLIYRGASDSQRAAMSRLSQGINVSRVIAKGDGGVVDTTLGFLAGASSGLFWNDTQVASVPLGQQGGYAPLSMLNRVEWGKRTMSFSTQVAQSIAADRCFSLVFRSVSDPQSTSVVGRPPEAFNFQLTNEWAVDMFVRSPKERDAVASLLNGMLDAYAQTQQSSNRSSSHEQHDLRGILADGRSFTGMFVNRLGYPQGQALWVWYQPRSDGTLGHIHWNKFSVGKQVNSNYQLDLSKLKVLMFGRRSRIFTTPPRRGSPSDENCCLTIVSPDGELNIVADCPEHRLAFVTALHQLLVSDGSVKLCKADRNLARPAGTVLVSQSTPLLNAGVASDDEKTPSTTTTTTTTNNNDNNNNNNNNSSVSGASSDVVASTADTVLHPSGVVTRSVWVRCERLFSCDHMSDSDPVVVFNDAISSRLIGTTEVIQDNHNPVFARPIRVPFKPGVGSRILITVYDADKGRDLSVNDMIGEVEVAMDELVKRFDGKLAPSGGKDDARNFVAIPLYNPQCKPRAQKLATLNSKVLLYVPPLVEQGTPSGPSEQTNQDSDRNSGSVGDRVKELEQRSAQGMQQFDPLSYRRDPKYQTARTVMAYGAPFTGYFTTIGSDGKPSVASKPLFVFFNDSKYCGTSRGALYWLDGEQVPTSDRQIDQDVTKLKHRRLRIRDISAMYLRGIRPEFHSGAGLRASQWVFSLCSEAFPEHSLHLEAANKQQWTEWTTAIRFMLQAANSKLVEKLTSNSSSGGAVERKKPISSLRTVNALSLTDMQTGVPVTCWVRSEKGGILRTKATLMYNPSNRWVMWFNQYRTFNGGAPLRKLVDVVLGKHTDVLKGLSALECSDQKAFSLQFRDHDTVSHMQAASHSQLLSWVKGLKKILESQGMGLAEDDKARHFSSGKYGPSGEFRRFFAYVDPTKRSNSAPESANVAVVGVVKEPEQVGTLQS